MSVSTLIDVASIVAAVGNFQTSHYLAVSSATVLFYDYLLCLPTGASFLILPLSY